MSRRYWLLKSEPDVYSIDDLRRDGETLWEGVRNYQARNFLRDDLKPGDGVLYYHSNAKPPGVAGIARVSRAGYPDPTQFDPKSKYHDPKSNREDPRWFCVDVAFEAKLPRLVSLDEVRGEATLADMPLINRSRLSVQPVTPEQWQIIQDMAGRSP